MQKTKYLILCLLLSLSMFLIIEHETIHSVNASPSYEDFTTFTEQDDTNDHIQEPSATHVDAKLYRNGKACLYKNYGVNHFGSSWEHKIDIKFLDFWTTFCGMIVMVGTDKGSQNHLINNAQSALYVYPYYSTNPKLSIREMYQGSIYESSTYTITTGTWYYLTVKRDGTSYTCKIYSDSARTNLLATLSLTLNANHPSHQYYQPCAEIEYSTGAYWGDWDIENLDLQEPNAYTVEFANMINVSASRIFYRELIFSHIETTSINIETSFLRGLWFSHFETLIISTEMSKGRESYLFLSETIEIDGYPLFWREFLFIGENNISVNSFMESLREYLLISHNELSINSLMELWKELKITEFESLETVNPYSASYYFPEYKPYVPPLWYENPLNIGIVCFLGFIGILCLKEIFEVWF